MTKENSQETEKYGDLWIESVDAKVPRWLFLSYCLLPIWGIVCLYLFCNGSLSGIMENGHWHQLQKAANTTFPSVNQNDPASFKPKAKTMLTSAVKV